MINKQGHTRMSQYYIKIPLKDRVTLEYELIRICLKRSDDQCSFFYLREHKIIYRRYASLYLIVGSTEDSNELGLYEFIHNIVEIFDKYFKSVCELDIMFNLEKVHFILNEMIIDGRIIGTNKTNVLYPLHLLDKVNKGQT